MTMYWKKGSREHDLLNSGTGLSFWWGALKPGKTPTLYFDVYRLTKAICGWKGITDTEKQRQAYSEALSPHMNLVTRAQVNGSEHHLVQAVKLPPILRAIQVHLLLDGAAAERIRIEFSEGAKDETRCGAPDDDYDYRLEGAPLSDDDDYEYVEAGPPPPQPPPPRPPSTRKRAAVASAEPPTPPPSRQPSSAGGGAEQLTAYNLRKTIRERRAAGAAASMGKTIVDRYEKTYGGRSGSKEMPQSVYANSQEENAADSRRLVYLLDGDADDEEVFDDERPPSSSAQQQQQGKDKEEADAADEEEHRDARSQRRAKRSKTQKHSNPPVASVGAAGAEQQQQQQQDEEDDDAFDPIEFSDDEEEDMLARVQPMELHSGDEMQEEEAVSHSDVRTETAALDEVLKIVQMTGLAMETQLKLAAFVQDRGQGAVYADEESRRADLKRIQDHMLELSRSLQTWTPMDRASAKQKTYTVISDTDGTEVRMADCAAELGIAWSAVSASTKRAIAELARDLHKKVYGRFPKKKRMPTGNGTMLPIYFYNRTTYVPTMKEAMTRLLLAPLPDDEPAAAAAAADVAAAQEKNNA